jgi:hypothetical protein
VIGRGGGRGTVNPLLAQLGCAMTDREGRGEGGGGGIDSSQEGTIRNKCSQVETLNTNISLMRSKDCE